MLISWELHSLKYFPVGLQSAFISDCEDYRLFCSLCLGIVSILLKLSSERAMSVLSAPSMPITKSFFFSPLSNPLF